MDSDPESDYSYTGYSDNSEKEKPLDLNAMADEIASPPAGVTIKTEDIKSAAPDIPATASQTPKGPKHKKRISFTYHSTRRKNVDKAIVRIIVNCHKKLRSLVLRDLRAESFTFEMYDEASFLLDNLQVNEREGRNPLPTKKKVKRDYASTINTMLENPLLRLIVEYTLYPYLEDLKQRKVKRIKNFEVYTVTVDEYLQYINYMNSLPQEAVQFADS